MPQPTVTVADAQAIAAATGVTLETVAATDLVAAANDLTAATYATEWRVAYDNFMLAYDLVLDLDDESTRPQALAYRDVAFVYKRLLDLVGRRTGWSDSPSTWHYTPT